MDPTPPARTWRPALALAALLAVHALVAVAPTWVRAARACFAYYDLGIYTQGLARLSWAEPNPWLSGLQRHLFNDHFDPVVWLARPLTLVLAPPWAALVAEALFVLLSAAPLAWLVRRGALTPRAGWLLAALLLLNPATLQALAYPVHPTTWAMLPMALLGAALVLGERRVALGALVLLFACKEEFPFVGVVLAAGLLARGERRFALQVGAFTLAWLVLVFVLRPLWLGPSVSYGSTLLEGLGGGAWTYLRARLAAPGFGRVGTLALVLAPVLVWGWRAGGRPDPLLWALLVPGLLIRFLGMKWLHHYGAPLMAGAVLALVPLVRVRRVPGWLVALSLLLLVTSGGERFARSAWRTLAPPGAFPAHCPADPAREASVRTALARLGALPPAPALLGGELIAFVAARPEVSSVGGPRPATVFRYVLVQKPPYGDPYPLTPARVGELVERWRATPGAEVLLEDRYVFLARGAFTLSE